MLCVIHKLLYSSGLSFFKCCIKANIRGTFSFRGSMFSSLRSDVRFKIPFSYFLGSILARSNPNAHWAPLTHHKGSIRSGSNHKQPLPGQAVMVTQTHHFHFMTFNLLQCNLILSINKAQGNLHLNPALPRHFVMLDSLAGYSSAS